jgi:hypothetical protein
MQPNKRVKVATDSSDSKPLAVDNLAGESKPELCNAPARVCVYIFVREQQYFTNQVLVGAHGLVLLSCRHLLGTRPSPEQPA